MANYTWRGVGHGTIAGGLLNLEGILIDSNEAQAPAWMSVLAEYGRGIPLATMRRMIGVGADQRLPVVADLAPETALGAAIITRRAVLVAHDFLPHQRPCPGVWALIARLRDAGWRPVLTGPSSLPQLHHLLAIPGGVDLIDATTAPDNVVRGKPALDSVSAALVKAGISLEEALPGDNPDDVEAVGQAGLGTIALRCGGWGDADLAGAIAVYDDPNVLLALQRVAAGAPVCRRDRLPR